jgi:mannose-6-phosphate isomerase-like protein (cupin superfamily)
MKETQADWAWTPAEAAALPIPSGRQSSRVFEDKHVEVRYYAPKVRDDQNPHERDELYVIASGSATFTRAGEHKPVTRGDVIQVPAGMEHRFVDLSDDFATWVVFYG